MDLCQQAERTGVNWISVHGRTSSERKEPVHYDAIKLVCVKTVIFYILPNLCSELGVHTCEEKYLAANCVEIIFIKRVLFFRAKNISRIF